MFTRVITSLVLALLVSASVALAEPRDAATQKRLEKYWKILGSTWDDSWRVAARIRVDKPIGEFEAYALAMAYFGAHIGLCGGPELPKDRGDRWIADTAEGYAGAPGPRIIIEKRFTSLPPHQKEKKKEKNTFIILKKSKQAIQRTSGSLGSSLPMKFHPQPAATRHPGSRR